MLILDSVTKAFGGQLVLDRFSLTFPDKGSVCLFGPSGCGKTTLLRCIAGLTTLDSGKITGLEGRRISYIFQENRLLPWVSALENVAAVLPKGEESHKAAGEWLSLVGLGNDAEKLPGELSGGMRQRVAIARAMAFGGDVLLMDEPFRALDEETRDSIAALLAERMPDALKILITHDRKEAQKIAETIYLLKGTPLEILGTESATA